MNNALENNDASWIRDLWIGSFTGMCGSSMLWDNQHRRDLWLHFGRLRSFVEGIDFDNSGDSQHKGWTNENDLRGDNLAEMMCLRNWEDNHKQAIGVIANRTYNYYTQSEGSPCNNKVPDADYEFASTVYTFPPSWGNEMMRLQIPKMGVKVRYNIEWYNVMTGNLISTTTALRSSASGKLDLPFPSLSGDASCPIVLFKVNKFKDKSALVNTACNKMNYPDSVETRYGRITDEHPSINNPMMKIYPNPGDDKITVEISGAKIINGLLEVLNCTGMSVYSEELSSSRKEICISFLENGIYLVRVRTAQGVFVTKFIKQ